MPLYSKPRVYEHTSRYGKYRQILDGSTSYIETFNKSDIVKSEEDKFHTVLTEQENRLDIIANIYYKDPSFSWVVALANDIIDPFVVPVGTILRIPPIVSLYNLGGALRRE
jgi:hypothetical protein